MNKSKILLGLVSFTVLATLFLYMSGYFTNKLSEQRIVVVSDYPELETAIIQQQLIPIDYQFTGTVVADQQAIISARLTASIAEVMVNVGAKVKQGDVLMRLESRDLNARLQQTEQTLFSAQAQLSAAEKEYDRVKELVAKKLLSQSQFDQVESQLKIAQANVKQAQASVNEAETTLSFSAITAPFDGLITQKNVNMGDTASPGMPLLTMYNPKKLQLEVYISEAQIKNVTLGMNLQYQLPTYAIQGEGEVVQISPSANSLSRSFMVKLNIDSSALIYPGIYGKVIVYGEKQSALQVPKSAVYQVGQLDYVKVVKNGLISSRLVQINDDFLVRKGLIAGDEVVLHPLRYH